jgi:hypothetical protein
VARQGAVLGGAGGGAPARTRTGNLPIRNRLRCPVAPRARGARAQRLLGGPPAVSPSVGPAGPRSRRTCDNLAVLSDLGAAPARRSRAERTVLPSQGQ